MIDPKGIATDDSGNIYVGSQHKLQKFTSTGELIKCVGRKGGKEGEFDVPRGLTLRDNLVYVCDHNNHRIQVFDLDLNFVRSIGSRGSGRGEEVTFTFEMAGLTLLSIMKGDIGMANYEKQVELTRGCIPHPYIFVQLLQDSEA